MEENIYMLSDLNIRQRIGKKIRELRLRQNLTQMQLAAQTQLSTSSIKKIENGEIGSFDSFIRVLRILGKLDILSLLLQEDISPNEYYDLVATIHKKRRKRASSSSKNTLYDTKDIVGW